ncbi:hypothetical protein PHIN7_09290 [Polynucleobacter sp. HIN7]|nr:hypothetical protein PHIN7_09290 [Polynucleobacter sp. HIN7]
MPGFNDEATPRDRAPIWKTKAGTLIPWSCSWLAIFETPDFGNTLNRTAASSTLAWLDKADLGGTTPHVNKAR